MRRGGVRGMILGRKSFECSDAGKTVDTRVAQVYE